MYLHFNWYTPLMCSSFISKLLVANWISYYGCFCILCLILCTILKNRVANFKLLQLYDLGFGISLFIFLFTKSWVIESIFFTDNLLHFNCCYLMQRLIGVVFKELLALILLSRDKNPDCIRKVFLDHISRTRKFFFNFSSYYYCDRQLTFSFFLYSIFFP